MSPQEMLHIMGSIKHSLARNSEPDISRISNKNGVFDVTSLTGEEICGNLFGLAVMMHITYRDEFFRECFQNKGIDFDDVKVTCLLVLAWERFFLDFNKRCDVEQAEETTWKLQDRIQRHIPREVCSQTKSTPWSKGWHISKYLVMSFIAALYLKFGCAKVYVNIANEKNHKKMVKHHKGRTHMIASKFAGQIGDSDFKKDTCG